MLTIREVWRSNFEHEMAILMNCLAGCDFIAVDTEFPGFLTRASRFAPESVIYYSAKQNVDSLKIIQLGVTLFRGRVGCENVCMTWQFNFSDFDPEIDPYDESAINLLTQHGIDFKKHKTLGVDSRVFGAMFLSGVLHVRRMKPLNWITFHGLYDMAYLLKAMTIRPLPETPSAFTRVLSEVFGLVSDVKHMAKFCDGMRGGAIGLKEAAQIRRVERVGESHQAGSDSLLTALVFAKMQETLGLDKELYEGFLYGIETRTLSLRPIPKRRPRFVVPAAVPPWSVPYVCVGPYPARAHPVPRCSVRNNAQLVTPLMHTGLI